MILYCSSGANGQHAGSALQAAMTHAAALNQAQAAHHPALTNMMSSKYTYSSLSHPLTVHC